MLNSGHKVIEIAEYLHVHRSTIYREMKRGEYTHRNSDYTEELRYSSDLGQKNHDWNAQGYYNPDLAEYPPASDEYSRAS